MKRQTDRTLAFAVAMLGLASIPAQAPVPAPPPQPAPAPKPAQPGEAAPAPEPLGQAATKAMVERFKGSDHWVQKAVILLSLNHYWHPVGSEMIVAALRDRDKRLRAFGVEALLRAGDGLLPTVVSAELIEELVQGQLSQSNKHFQARVLDALARIAPDADAKDKAQWQKWWRAAKEGYQPKPWKPMPAANSDAKSGANSGTVSFAQRAFDLYQSGLDLVLCIDSTGSMQPTIDSVSAALGEMVDILKGISPKLRLGLVHYKEIGDFGDHDKIGAQMILALSKNVPAVRKRLLQLKAKGGGDIPERVAGGLEISFGRKMNWSQEANKVVIVIGDAPPHDAARAKQLAQSAFKDPGSEFKNPTTGPRVLVRPFITSAIGVRVKLGAGVTAPREFLESQDRMKTDFQGIAQSGGGVYAEIEFEVRGNKRGQIETVDPQKAEAAARKMVEHILVLSFGQRFAQEMRSFVSIYYDYKTARFFE